MIEELHPLRYHYEGVQPYVKVTAYELSSVDCSSNKYSGYYGETATLTANAAPAGYNFSGWNITGSNMTGNSFRFQGDVTAKAGYSAIPVVYNLTLQTDGHGKIGANKTTGYSGDTVTLSNTASAGYSFKNYTVTGATINGSTLTFGNSNCTAKANYSVVTGGPFTARIVFDKHSNGNDPHVCIVSAQPSLTANFAISNLFVTANTQYFPEVWTTAYVFNSAHKVNNLSISYTGVGSAVGGTIKHVLQINDSVRFSAIGNNLATVTFTGTANNVTLKSMGEPYYMYTYPNAEFMNNNNIYWSTIGSATATITGVLV